MPLWLQAGPAGENGILAIETILPNAGVAKKYQ